MWIKQEQNFTDKLMFCCLCSLLDSDFVVDLFIMVNKNYHLVHIIQNEYTIFIYVFQNYYMQQKKSVKEYKVFQYLYKAIPEME